MTTTALSCGRLLNQRQDVVPDPMRTANGMTRKLPLRHHLVRDAALSTNRKIPTVDGLRDAQDFGTKSIVWSRKTDLLRTDADGWTLTLILIAPNWSQRLPLLLLDVVPETLHIPLQSAPISMKRIHALPVLPATGSATQKRTTVLGR